MKFYIFGDSICFGQLVSSHKSWVNSLAMQLEKVANPKKNYLIQNASINGNTTRQALERIHYDLTSHQPKIVFIQFGMNDCNYWETDYGLPRVSKDSFQANLKEIIDKCFASGTKHIFVNTNHISLKGGFKHINKITYDDSNLEYNKLIRKQSKRLIGQKYPITLLETEKIFQLYLLKNKKIKLSDLLLDDGIHLSVLGHQVYADNLIPIIIKKIKEIN